MNIFPANSSGNINLNQGIKTRISRILMTALPLLLMLVAGMADISAQTIFTAAESGSWTSITWTKSGPSAATYPGEPGYESETHDVVINGAGIILTLDADITTSVRNVTLNTGTLDISASTLTMTGNLTGASTLTFASGRLNIGGDNTSTGTLNVGIGTFNYNGADQVIRGTTYYNLEIAGTGTKTLGGNTTITNDLIIFSGQLETANRAFSVNNGTTTIFTGGELTANSTTGNKTLRNVVLSGGSITSPAAVAETFNISGTVLCNNNATSTIGDISTTVSGTVTVTAGSTLAFSGTGGTKIFTNQVIVSGGWNNSANEDLTFRNGLTFGGDSFISGSGTYTFNTNSQSILGTQPLVFDGPVTIGANITLSNFTNVTIKGVLSGGSPSTWRNAAGSVLNYENAVQPMNGLNRTLNATANSNLVNYSGTGDQAIKGTTYYNLTTSGSGTKTLQAATTVSRDLNITGTTTLLTNQYQITGNAAGHLTMDPGTSLLLGSMSNTTAVTFPTNLITANISLDQSSTVVYYANTSQTVSSVPVYGNLSTATSGTKTLAGDITVTGNLNIGTATTLSTGAGNYDITLEGSWASNGSFTENQGTVTFAGTGPQAVSNILTGTETFYDLVINTAGPVTSSASLTALNSLTMAQGNILMPGKTFLLGTGAAAPGSLAYTTGWVEGTFSRWATPSQSGADLLFPVGDNSTGRNFTLNFSNISSAGILSVNFAGGPPSTPGLPLFEDIYVFNNLFPEGYWQLAKNAAFNFTGTFDLELIPAGFTTYPIDANTRILSRPTASNWTLNGTHAAGSPAILYRNGLTAFTNEYAVAPADICIPAFTGCPADIVINNAPGTCGNTVSWVAPAMNLACPGYVVTSNYNPGDLFNVGVTQVAYYIMKGTARIDSCKFNVIVNDNELPVVLCRNITVYLDGSGSAVITGADIDNGSSDNCSILLTTDITSFDCGDAGSTIPVMLTGTDPSGNSASCTAQVTVLDNLPPLINTKSATLFLDASGNGTLLPSMVDNGTSDNCTLDATWVTPNTFTCADQGSHIVTFHARDASGNESSAPVTIMVESTLNIISTSLSNCDLAGPFALYKSEVTGGDGNYTYLWDGLDDSVDPFVTITGVFPFLVFSNTSTEETPFFNNLMPDGTYTIRLVVTDQGGMGCRDTMDMVIVKAGLVFNNVSVRHSQACEGTIVTYSVTEDPDATYNWGVSNGTILTSPLDTSRVDVLWNMGVPQGVVIATSQKTNILGDPCESTVVDTVTINSVPVPAFNAPVTNVCYNNVTTYTLTEPYDDYTWTVTGGTVSAGGTGSNFVSVLWGTGPAGRVTVLVETAAGCSASTFVDVNIDYLTGSVTSLTHVTCNGANDGQVTVAPDAGSGIPPFVYSLDGGPFAGSGTFTGLGPGNHFVTIRDAFLCTYNVSFTITQPPVLSANISTVNILCFGGNNGSISVSGTGGTPPYEYSLDGGAFQASGSYTGLTAGIHPLIVRDAKSCTFNQNIVLTQPAAALTASAVVTDVLCFGGTDGKVDLTVAGGTIPYTFVWSNGATTEDLTNVAAGTYSVTVTDANSCTATASGTVNQPPVLVASAINSGPVCVGDPLTLTGGPNGMATYAWTGPAGFTSALQSPLVSASATPAMAGTYTLTVTDLNGCTDSETTVVSVNPDNTITLSSPVGTDNQTVCAGTPISTITYATTGATSAIFMGLPAGVNGSFAANTVTISGTPAVDGTFPYSVTLAGGCGTAVATGTITVNPENTITLTSAPGTDDQTVCLGTPIVNITYLTTGATGATFTGLPAGMMVSWAGNNVTISGSPTTSGIYSYIINLTGGCGTVSETGTITVTPLNTITLSSSPGTDNQTVCINNPITNITYTTTGATGASFSGLPAGVLGSWAGDVVTINGTPAVDGIFNYTVTLTGGCGNVTASGTINVSPENTVTLTSAPGTDAQTVCINTAITNITYTTTGATGADITGLPAGVTGSWLANTVTISGTPVVQGTFTYVVTLTGGCGTAVTTGTLTVNPDNTIALTSAPGTDAQEICINTAVTPIIYSTTGATGASVTGLPLGVTGTWLADFVTISGTPSEAGTFNYTVTLTGGCGNVTAVGSLTVRPDNTVTLTSGAGTDNQSVCMNTALTDITYATTGATGATVSGLPAGVTGTWAADVVTISGIPLLSGTFNYLVTLTGGCGTVTAGGTINSTPDNTITLTSPLGTDGQTVCINSAITSITYSTTGATGAIFNGLPEGVTGVWASDIVTISGTPTVTGLFNYTITLTGGCGTAVTSGTMNVRPENTITLTSAPGTDNQTICIGDPIVTINYVTTTATGANFTGLPAGMTVAWSADVVTITGTPANPGVYTYQIDLTGGCGSVYANGTITVLPLNSVTLTSPSGTDNQTVCINTPLTSIEYNTTGATGASFSGLPAGVTGLWASDKVTISGIPAASGTFIYSVTLTGGCGMISTSGTINVTPDNTITLSSAPGTDNQTVCEGSPLTDITYSTAGATGADFAGLPSGVTGSWAADIVTIGGTPTASGTFNYTITLTGGCGTVTGTGTIMVSPILPVSVTVAADANPVCAGTTVNFTATAVNGGTAPVFQWQVNGTDVGTGGSVFGYIPVEDDSVRVILLSSEMCTSGNPDTSEVLVMTVHDLPVVTASVTDVACYGQATGSVDLTITSGALPAAFLWSNGETTEDISGVPAGTYSVVVTDANNCSVNVPVMVSEPATPLSGTITSQTDVSVIGGNDGSVTVDGSGGTPPYLYSLNGGVFQPSGTFGTLTAGNYIVTVQDLNLCTFDVPVLIKQPFLPLTGSITSQTNVLCYGEATGSVTVAGSEGVAPYEYSLNGGTYQSSGVFIALAAGPYTVTIRDSYGNTFDVPVIITQPAAALAVSTTKIDVRCNGGSDGMAVAIASGGTGAYAYSWNTTPVQAADTARGLSPGTYTVTVTDANLCTVAGNAVIGEPPALALVVTTDPAECPDSNDGSITLSISGGTPAYGVIWSDGNTSQNRIGVLPGEYSVVVTDANGCAAAGSAEVGFVGTWNCVVIPDIITPDPADGYNDLWIIRNIQIYPNAEVKVYSRWGKLIYHSKNPLAEPWDGRYSNGTLVPTDSYRYILDLHDGSKLRSGVISVIRQ